MLISLYLLHPAIYSAFIISTLLRLPSTKSGVREPFLFGKSQVALNKVDLDLTYCILSKVVRNSSQFNAEFGLLVASKENGLLFSKPLFANEKDSMRVHAWSGLTNAQ